MLAPSWARGARVDRGHRLADGGTKTLPHFLAEAAQAARSFREHNANIEIAIVTNNETVDAAIFDIHIAPRVRKIRRSTRGVYVARKRSV